MDTQNRTEIYQKSTKEVKGGGNTDRYPRSVIKGPSDKQTSHLHPTQKPVWLCEKMVLTYTNPGEIVLDCCAGSASIGVACCEAGRRYIGIENDREYYDLMRDRLRKCADSPNGHCFEHDIDTNGQDFCSYGERREGGNDDAAD